MRDQWIRDGNFFIVCHSYTHADLDNVRRQLELIRRIKDIGSKPLPAFVAVRPVG